MSHHVMSFTWWWIKDEVQSVRVSWFNKLKLYFFCFFILFTDASCLFHPIFPFFVLSKRYCSISFNQFMYFFCTCLFIYSVIYFFIQNLLKCISVCLPDKHVTLNVSSCLQVRGDETRVLQSVLECDTEREKLLEEERKLLTLTHGR